jgi:hypothetical protein
MGGSDVGSLGTTAQLGLTPDEDVLDARDGLVISRRGTPYPSWGNELVIREFATGTIVREITTSVYSLDALLVGRRLFWTGMVAASGDCALRDGGVWALDLDAGGEPVAIVPIAKRVMSCFTGRRLLVSPSGQTVGGVMASYGNDNWIDVIDVETLVRRQRIKDVWPDAITDDTWIQWDQRPTDGIAPGLGGTTAYDLVTKSVRWRFPDAVDVPKYTPSWNVALGSAFYIQYYWTKARETDVFVAEFDALTGARRRLVRTVEGPGEDLLLRGDLSSPFHLALERRPDDSLAPAEPRTYAVIDVAAGTVDWNAFTIDPPWICNTEYCFRD